MDTDGDKYVYMEVDGEVMEQSQAAPDPMSGSTRVTIRVCVYCQQAIMLNGAGIWEHIVLTGENCEDDKADG